jgi:predicted nucleic acid-binding protein
LIIDTDVLIWFFRGSLKAARLLEGVGEPSLSIVSLMELYQGARSREEITALRRFFQENAFRIIPVNEAVSHLAATLMEEHRLKHGIQLADALIAATAREAASVLLTGNLKHFRFIPALELQVFRP